MVTVRVSDQIGLRDEVTFNLSIQPVNDAPIAYPLELTTLEDNAIDGRILADDIDGTIDEFRIINDVTEGVLDWNPEDIGRFTYTPRADFNGQDQFTIVAIDDVGEASDPVFIIIVLPENDAPSAENGELVTDEDTAVNGQMKLILKGRLSLSKSLAHQPMVKLR